MLLCFFMGAYSSNSTVVARNDATYNSRGDMSYQQKVKIQLNDYIITNYPVIIRNDRSLVPLDFVQAKLDAQVEWDQRLRKVQITSNKEINPIRIRFQFDEEPGVLVKLQGGYKDLIPPGTDAVLLDDQVMVPLRFVAELLGCEVNWDPDAKTVIITGETTVEETTNIAAVHITPTNNNSTITLRQGQLLEVKLPENQSIGYNWNFFTLPDSSVLNLVASNYRTDANTLGATGEFSWQFMAIKPGDTSFCLWYIRLGESEKPADQFEIKVKVLP